MNRLERVGAVRNSYATGLRTGQYEIEAQESRNMVMTAGHGFIGIEDAWNVLESVMDYHGMIDTIHRDFNRNYPILIEIAATHAGYRRAAGGEQFGIQDWRVNFPPERVDDHSLERMFHVLGLRLASAAHFTRPTFTITVTQNIAQMNTQTVNQIYPGVGNLFDEALRSLSMQGMDFRGNVEWYIHNKRGICQIRNLPAGDCFTFWLVLGCAQLTNPKLYDRLRREDAPRLREDAVATFKRIHPNWNLQFQDVELLKDIETTLGVRLCIFDLMDGMKLYYPPEDQLPFLETKHTLYGLLSYTDPHCIQAHIDLVLKPAALQDKSRWCSLCLRAYKPRSKREHHKGPEKCIGANCQECVFCDGDICSVCHVCAGRCWACQRTQCIYDQNWYRCSKCNLKIRNEECHSLHICPSITRICLSCDRPSHAGLACDELKCLCGDIIEEIDLDTHICYVPRKKAKKTSDKWGVLDFECFTTKENIHVPYLVCVWLPTPEGWGLSKHMEKEFGDHVSYHPSKPDQPVFYFFDPTGVMDLFFKFINDVSFAKWVFFSHNGQGYDHILLKSLFMKRGIQSEDIVRGEKFLQISFPKLKLKFRDSLCFLPMALRKMPVAFGLTEVSKGHFPHKIMNEKIWEKLLLGDGCINKPALEDFDVDFGFGEKPAVARAEAIAWINGWINEGPTWNVMKTSLEYCVSDVFVLGEALQEFRKQVFTQTGGLDPLVYPTMASAIHNWYLSTALPEKTLAVIHPARTNRSYASDQWLCYMEHTTKLEIIREWKVGPYRVDGFALDSTGGGNAPHGVAFEFAGCYYHGCPRCTRQDSKAIQFGCTYGKLYRAFELRCDYIRAAPGIRHLVIQWECDWRSTRSCVDVQSFLKLNADLLRDCAPLNPREAYRGGMTELYCLHDPGKIVMSDFVSEYPSICLGKLEQDHLLKRRPGDIFEHGMEFPLPVGSPTSYRGPNGMQRFEACIKNKTLGFGKVRIVPPRDLYAPYAHYLTTSKEAGNQICLFPLCKTCSNERRFQKCDHYYMDKSWIGTWTLHELYHMLSLGYDIITVYELWEYPEGSTVLFRDFMMGFLMNKIKAKTEGLVENGEFTTDGRDMAAYIQRMINQHTTAADFQDNDALRESIKIIVNSLTGKFGEKPHTEVSREFYGVRGLKEARAVLQDPTCILLAAKVLDDSGESVYLKYDKRLETTKGEYEISLPVIAYITAYGRIEINCVVIALGEDAIYCDTDSVYHHYYPEAPLPYRTGRKMGDLEMELPPKKNGRYWTGILRKSYAYLKTIKDENDKPMTQAVIKMKGIRLDVGSDGTFGPDVLLELIYKTFKIRELFPGFLELPRKEREDLWATAQATTKNKQFLTRRNDDRTPFKKTVEQEKRIRYHLFDSKRVPIVLEDGRIISYPYGHCKDTPWD